MSHRLVGYQPQYFPRLHYYARVLNADTFKISDNLQYVRRHAYPSADGKTHNGPSYQAHTPIKSASGILLLDVSVRHVGNQDERMLNTAELDYTGAWAQKHLRGIAINYSKAPHYKEVYPSLERLLNVQYANLAELTIATTAWGFAQLFEIPLIKEAVTLAHIESSLPAHSFRLKRIVRMSEIGLKPAGKIAGQDINAWLIQQCAFFGADEYYFGGTAASTYIDQDRLIAAGITPLQQEWRAAPYKQQFAHIGFTSNLSIIDLVMNVPAKQAREIVTTPNQ